jgi:23S rRNA (guanosine2251-2'-O)-methyltransferase
LVSLRVLIANCEREKSNGIPARPIHRVFCDRARAQKEKKEYSWLCHRAEALGFVVDLCDRDDIDDIAVGNTHGGIVAVCGDRHFLTLTENEIPSRGFFVLLDGIEDPYNFGYALRSLYAAGVDGILLPERNWMSAAGVVCRASAGASELLPIYIGDAENAVSTMKGKGYRIISADLRDSVSLYDADLSLPLLLVVGGEKRGISSTILETSDLRVRIDYAREFAASLSAASAATVCAYEVFRQNR